MSTSLDTIKARFGIVGHSLRLNTAIEIATQVAPTEVTVLVSGENGTGKDVFSRIIHQFSRRKHAPFIAINCGAIPEGTMDSELFGHEKGSFTSAYEQRKGYFEEVNGGTIFLDEIAEMPLATQSRLLRVLENGEYLRVGSSKVRKTEVRVIAATNKNLIDMIRRGKFREDLYFRLNTVSISVPPLRERGQDIELLFQQFAEEFAAKYRRPPLLLSEDARDLLYQYRWPGNVRELRNFVEKVTVLVHDTVLTSAHISQYLEIQENYLPVLVDRPSVSGGESSPREVEMLYKLIFDLKAEVSELKKMMFMGMQPASATLRDTSGMLIQEGPSGVQITQPQIFNPGQEMVRKPTALLEESLSLEVREKELIVKALKKHADNRKKAARELGISERTLYRKIKQYGIE